ncbi:hypothetical protein, partial [Paenilisteria weihenstephanensis]|uniref:hypothetical protein n=1 Tax=Listeria weihenstephanensis TaxID=1006155 RepID=UPI001C8AB71C
KNGEVPLFYCFKSLEPQGLGVMKLVHIYTLLDFEIRLICESFVVAGQKSVKRAEKGIIK